jgi:hypothetical protein
VWKLEGNHGFRWNRALNYFGKHWCWGVIVTVSWTPLLQWIIFEALSPQQSFFVQVFQSNAEHGILSNYVVQLPWCHLWSCGLCFPFCSCWLFFRNYRTWGIKPISYVTAIVAIVSGDIRRGRPWIACLMPKALSCK